MNRQEAIKTSATLAGIITASFPNFKTGSQMIAVWADIISDVNDSDSLIDALKLLICEGNAFAPTIGEIRKKAILMSNRTDRNYTAYEAWYRVCDDNRRTQLTALEKYCLKCIGGSWSIRTAYNLEKIRSDFIKFYESKLKVLEAELLCPKSFKYKQIEQREEPKKTAMPELTDGRKYTQSETVQNIENLIKKVFQEV